MSKQEKNRLAATLGVVCVSLILLTSTAFQQGKPVGSTPAPIDPQQVRDQDLMTWADYRPIPGRNWADPSLKPERGFRLAVVGIDFPGQPFVVSLPKGSDPLGNPQIDPVARENVPHTPISS